MRTQAEKNEYQRQWRAKNPGRSAEYNRRYKERHPEKLRGIHKASKLKANFGLTQREYDDMYTAQSCVCAICGSYDTRTLAVDHDHKTGKVRALLCHRCNPGLGYFLDDPERLEAAAAYLRRWSQ